MDELSGEEIAVCDPVRMEVLAGARDELHLPLRRLLARPALIQAQPTDFETAAALHRRFRVRGGTVRNLVDRLAAAMAIRAGAPVLHSDADFEVTGRHTEPRIYGSKISPCTREVRLIRAVRRGERARPGRRHAAA